MAREENGTWVIQPPVADVKLEPVEPNEKRSAASSRSPAEAPLHPAAAEDSSDGRGAASAKDRKKPVKLAAS
jgi:hypothetical protein